MREFLLGRPFEARIVREPVVSKGDPETRYGTVVKFMKHSFTWPLETCVISRKPLAEMTDLHRVAVFRHGKVTTYREASTYRAFAELAADVIKSAKPRVRHEMFAKPRKPEAGFAEMSDEDAESLRDL
ncbi:hypothetical protein [Methylobacterium sp. J-090]|uniref:hypothetical protein n=1 Tax=Methylobacterium sp. J-090 TaxID=2836666 RepID=UPI001FBB2BF9|nr:hypothetical protein [Methylobacterium sp. J-090]MCJ2084194.1 hypothetical protein [Methylobacterium sp. J-090]